MRLNNKKKIYSGIHYYITNSLCMLLGIKYLHDFKTLISVQRIEAIPKDALINLVEAFAQESSNYDSKLDSDTWKTKVDIVKDILQNMMEMKLVKVEGGYRLFLHDDVENIEEMLIKPLVYKCDDMSKWIFQTLINEQFLIEHCEPI